MTGSVDLRPDYEEAVKRILAEYVPECEVRAFGSRAAWTAKDYSDLDLAVGGEGPLDWRTLDRLKEAFEESDLPMRVDVLDWHAISDSFREVIERDYVVMQERAKQAMTGVWREVALGEIAEIFDGPHATPSKTDGGPVFLGISNLVNGRIDLSTTQHLSEDDYLTWTRRVTPMAGDVVFSYETRLGEAAAIPHELRCCLGRRMGLLRPRTERVDPHFLLYAYLGARFQETIRARAVQGSTVDRILLSEMGTFPIAIPIDVAEQRAIAHVLGTLDDKIELNRRMNETLEEVARALFKSWFVDFEPVRAKIEGRWRRGESLPGMPAELYDLFPGRLVGSEVGEVPEGWEVKALGDCFELTMGQSPPGSTYNDDGDGMPFFQGSTDFQFRYPDKRRFCTAPTRIAEPDDTLVSVRAPVGDINMAWERSCIGRGVAALRHKSGSRSFTYYSVWAMQRELQQYEHTGTVFGAINRKQFQTLRVVEPIVELIARFERQVQSLDGRIRANVSDSRAVTTQRDALLPKLISGKWKGNATVTKSQ